MIDTHSHIYLPEFDDDRDDVVLRARNSGISKIVLPNVDSGTIEALYKVGNGYPCFCEKAMGLHPTSVNTDYKKNLSVTGQELSKGGFCAIGEIGLDFYWDKSCIKEQTDAFEIQLNWAVDLGLPVIIHARESLNEIISIIKKIKKNNLSGVFHSFTGNNEQASEILSLGRFYFGVNGIVTFKNSQMQDVIKKIGIQNLVLETDAPYLAPVPYRGKRNEPAYLKFVAEKLAVLFELKETEIDHLTTANARFLFNFR